MGRPPLEKVNQDTDTVGKIDPGIAVEIIQAHLARSIAGQLGRLAEEEVAQEADAIREIEAAIAIAITGRLAAADKIVVKTLGDCVAAEGITDLQDRETRGGARRREDLQGLAITEQAMLRLVAADRDLQPGLVKIKTDHQEGVAGDTDVALDMLDDRQQPAQRQDSIGELRRGSHRVPTAIRHDVQAAGKTGGIGEIEGCAGWLLRDDVHHQPQDLYPLAGGDPAFDDRLGQRQDDAVDKLAPGIVDNAIAELGLEPDETSAEAVWLCRMTMAEILAGAIRRCQG